MESFKFSSIAEEYLMSRNSLYHNIPNHKNVKCLEENRTHNILTSRAFVLPSPASETQRKKTQKHNKPKLD